MLGNYSVINFVTPLKSIPSRSCNGCTACCEGWLSGSIYGYPMYREKPCKFIDKDTGCSIYETRPSTPCKTFICYWKQNEIVPERFKPSSCGNIMIYRQSEQDLIHLDILEGSKPLSTEVLDWALEMYLNKKIDSLRWFMNNNMTTNYVSRNQKFIEKMNSLLIESYKAGLV